ncbi:type II secretion system F family protein [Herbiconiux sp. VKM Ac-1786]|uniref:type II secretion system F family protein n=1 Tax=Herbiconiux sp. VKM Ac-1786 TaxID=2783824 RepID=UPI00188A8D1E|nr:type II secretion system F family protein [Herbiconiux sp. VKM Ac-1786]
MVERLAALIGAGVAPAQAWRYLAEVEPHPQVAAVVARLDGGADVAHAIAGAAASAAGSAHRGRASAATESWHVLAAAWSVATSAGAPLAHCLDDIAATLRGLAQAERDTSAALASPQATTRLVLFLPVISIAGASLLGLDTLQVLLGTPPGLVCLAGGIALTALGALWSRHLVRRAAPIDRAPGLLLDLTAVAIAGGGSLPAARTLALTTIERLAPTALAPPPDRPASTQSAPAQPTPGRPASRQPASRQPAFGQPAPGPSASGRPASSNQSASGQSGSEQLSVLAEVLALAERSGAPPAQLLRSEALRLRRESVARTQRRTAELGVWLMLPLGTCVLPSFLLLAVAPLLLAALPPALL